MESIVQAERQASSEINRLRWAVGLNGVLSVAVGVVILFWPGISLFALTILWGAYMTASGVVGLGTAIGGRIQPHRGWLAFVSVLSIFGGLLVLVWPNIGALALLYIIGAYAIAFGVMMTSAAFALPLDGADRAMLFFSGLVSILFGIVMFVRPGDGALVVLALIAAFSLVLGLSELVVAIGGKRLVERQFKNAVESYESQSHEPSPHPTS